jgi:hypothetical protein
VNAGDAPRSYLQITNWRRFQHYHDQTTPKWVKFYTSTLEDGSLLDQTIATRLLASLLLLVAARTQNQIPDSAKIVAGYVQLPTKTVTTSLKHLEKIGFLERVFLTDSERRMAQTGQLRLVSSRENLEQAEEKSSPRVRPRTRGETEAETERPTSNATSTSNPASATPDQPRALPGGPEPLEQLIDESGARGTSSERTMRAIAHGKPEHVHARALESFRGRQPRPDNPIGYAIQCLRLIAADTGRQTTKITREPEL